MTRCAASRTTLNARTLSNYCRSFRRIVSESFELGSRRGRPATKGSKHREWLARVDAVRLSTLTSDVIQRWKKFYLSRAGTGPVKKRGAATSLNTILRQAKSLFSNKVTRFLEFEPGFKSPFDGVLFEPRHSMKYHSEIRLEQVVRWAFHGNAETGLGPLPREEQKILLLASLAGLRRNEIDKLQWSAFHWHEGTVRIAATSFYCPKTEESLGDIPLDPEMLALFQAWEKDRQGDFVIESPILPRVGCGYSHYRCEHIFKCLLIWLRKCGITSNNPIHVLRKEYGSQTCARYGIFVASRALRHADIHITSQHYLDQRQKFAPGLGFMLKKAPAQIAVA